MGRHSAPDDDDEVVSVAAADPALDEAPRGRHARLDEAALALAEAQTIVLVPPQFPPAFVLEPPTQELDPDRAAPTRGERVDLEQSAPPAVAPTDPGPLPFFTDSDEAESDLGQADLADTDVADADAPTAARKGFRADAALIRSKPGLKARLAAAILVPFALYFVVMIALGRLNNWVFIVIPIFVAGVLFGLMLDLADRDQATVTPAAPSDRT